MTRGVAWPLACRACGGSWLTRTRSRTPRPMWPPWRRAWMQRPGPAARSRWSACAWCTTSLRRWRSPRWRRRTGARTGRSAGGAVACAGGSSCAFWIVGGSTPAAEGPTRAHNGRVATSVGASHASGAGARRAGVRQPSICSHRCAQPERSVAAGREPQRGPGGWICRRCGRRLAHGRGGTQRCPISQVWDEDQRLGVAEAAARAALAHVAAFWKWARRPPEVAPVIGLGHRV